MKAQRQDHDKLAAIARLKGANMPHATPGPWRVHTGKYEDGLFYKVTPQDTNSASFMLVYAKGQDVARNDAELVAEALNNYQQIKRELEEATEIIKSYPMGAIDTLKKWYAEKRRADLLLDEQKEFFEELRKQDTIIKQLRIKLKKHKEAIQ